MLVSKQGIESYLSDYGRHCVDVKHRSVFTFWCRRYNRRSNGFQALKRKCCTITASVIERRVMNASSSLIDGTTCQLVYASQRPQQWIICACEARSSIQPFKLGRWGNRLARVTAAMMGAITDSRTLRQATSFSTRCWNTYSFFPPAAERKLHYAIACNSGVAGPYQWNGLCLLNTVGHTLTAVIMSLLIESKWKMCLFTAM